MNKEILERAKNIFKNQEFLSFVNMKLESIENKKAIISCENKKELSQGLGYMHGGMVAAILDTAGGFAAFTVIPSNCHLVTSELKINYMRPVISKKVFGIGEVISQGKKLIVVEATLKDEADNMLAKMMATMFVVEDKK
ncbi:PaaI family thioesterase [uncultured Brachyspira sp.]|jgi:thioesterase superfamily protein|uniref:PaaI family thioesterase n=1 Tax=uncultured Brachyspira sp. TaxID=221953 RepID=UPI00320840E5